MSEESPSIRLADLIGYTELDPDYCAVILYYGELTDDTICELCGKTKRDHKKRPEPREHKHFCWVDDPRCPWCHPREAVV